MSNYLGTYIDQVKPYCTKKLVNQGERLFKQGDQSLGCYIIESGNIATSCFDSDIQSESIIQTYQQGDVLGAVGLIDTENRAVTAIATSYSEVWFISQLELARLMKKEPMVYQHFVVLASATIATKFRELHQQVSQFKLMKATSPVVDEIVERSAQAQLLFTDFPEHKLDEMLMDIAQAVYGQALPLAIQAVEDTGMGVVEHKVRKIQLGTIEVADSLIGKPGNGAIQLEAVGVETITMPIGVVFGMIPVTNPVETVVFKTLSSLKARNSIIISSHRKAKDLGIRVVNIIREVLFNYGAPVDLIQTPELPANRKLTQAFMQHDKVNFILATGGPSMVKSAYQSGKPAIGVGKGNAPVWICQDADIKKAAQDVITSKSFDNGVVCGSENNLILDANIADTFLFEAEKFGAAVLTPEEITQVYQSVYEHDHLRPEWVGQTAQKIAEHAGIFRPFPISLLLVKVEADDYATPFVREKLMPCLSYKIVHGSEQALTAAKSILNLEGKGHTAIVHSADKATIQSFANAVEVSRVLVNSPGTQGCIGACNGLQLSWTLGCGTHGGGSSNDNITYQHLQNIKRIAY